MPFQYVTIVAYGGTPVRICNSRGGPLPTTGTGALVFSNGAVLDNPVLNNPTYDGDLTVTGDLTVEGEIIGGVGYGCRTITAGLSTIEMTASDYELNVAFPTPVSLTILLPANPENGRTARITDGLGGLNYGSVEFTVEGADGELINGASSFMMQYPFMSTQFRFASETGRWNIVQ